MLEIMLILLSNGEFGCLVKSAMKSRYTYLQCLVLIYTTRLRHRVWPTILTWSSKKFTNKYSFLCSSVALFASECLLCFSTTVEIIIFILRLCTDVVHITYGVTCCLQQQKHFVTQPSIPPG